MSATGPRILFAVDAGPEIGGGHVMRSLTLAEALARRGAICAFLASPAVEAVLDRFGSAQIERIAVSGTDPGELIAQGAGLAYAFSGVVFDHFRLDATAQAVIADGRPALAVDDLADRPLACDLLVDPGPDRRTEDYGGLIVERTTLLLGPSHGLVRPDFAGQRAGALSRRSGETVQRVLVSLGLTDVGGVTGTVVSRMLPRLGEAALDVVVGRAAPSLTALQALVGRDARLRLHVETDAMADLAAAADLAVGAGGSSTWERCVLGLPTLLLVLADNQAPSAQALARRGAAEVVDVRAPDFEAAFDRAFTGLMRDPSRRARLSRESAALCDGLGAERVADAFLELIKARE